MDNVSHIGALKPGWTRVRICDFTENDLVEIITALKFYHDDLLENPKREDWPEVRKSLREIIAKCYMHRDMEDNDPVREA